MILKGNSEMNSWIKIFLENRTKRNKYFVIELNNFGKLIHRFHLHLCGFKIHFITCLERVSNTVKKL